MKLHNGNQNKIMKYSILCTWDFVRRAQEKDNYLALGSFDIESVFNCISFMHINSLLLQYQIAKRIEELIVDYLCYRKVAYFGRKTSTRLVIKGCP